LEAAKLIDRSCNALYPEERLTMFDDLERLPTNPSLRSLLAHYADLAQGGREIWQDRLMTIDGIDTAEVSRLHGQLIAFDWIEQNTGQLGPYKPGAVTGCYRVTTAGLRAMRLAKHFAIDEESEENAVEGGESEESSHAVIPVEAVATDNPGVPLPADAAVDFLPNDGARAA
jgi:hypothetical protein